MALRPLKCFSNRNRSEPYIPKFRFSGSDSSRDVSIGSKYGRDTPASSLDLRLPPIPQLNHSQSMPVLAKNYEEEDGQTSMEKAKAKAKIVEEKQGEDVMKWSWVIDIKKATGKEPRRYGGHSIFMVSRNLLQLDPNSLIPQVVSIGPYHRGKPHLREMEKLKWRILLNMINRTGCDPESLVQRMADLEPVARDCYDQPSIWYNKEEFAKMMLLDACFILELFQWSLEHYKDQDSVQGPIFTLRGISPYIQRDLLMLENQLPLFVLNHLFDLITVLSRSENHQSLANIAIKYFSSAIPFLNQPCSNPDQLPHILEIVRRSMLPEKAIGLSVEDRKGYRFIKGFTPETSLSSHPEAYSDSDEDNKYEMVMHSVTELRSTGVKFKMHKHSEKLLDIKFDKGILYIPPLVIHGSTKSIFLNMMAFEQFYPNCSSHYITSYVSFMDGLINSPKDVEHLLSTGILEHSFGSEQDVADLFNNLRKEIVFDTGDYYLAGVSDALHKHSKRRVNGWNATLRHEYLKDPWKVISLSVAALLIVLTVAQVAYAAVAYHFPSS